MNKIRPVVISLLSKFIVVSVLASLSTISLMVQNCFAESKKIPTWYPDSSCVQQYESVGKVCASQPRPTSAIQLCIQEKVSAECISQMKNAQNHLSQILPNCTEANKNFIQKLKTTCGNASNENEACYKRIRLEFEANIQEACGGMQ
ncbi:MAG: hypothetical protein PHP95_10845 [Desulfuromonadaceae bacterium]|nr:hypothetical protein [Desulfuromonadaceae bacterium]MDD2848943.1 hypothetical protein [Desulfuromonadaceae bacterium]MDD4131689.1 hypothetical protein [Desulfuromonadaceae bacterium]